MEMLINQDIQNDMPCRLANLEKSRFYVAASSANRAPLFNRFLWKDYSNRVMEAGTANAPHIVARRTGEMLTDSLLRSIDFLLERHDVLNCSIEAADGNLYLVRREKRPAAFREVVVAGETKEEREDEAYRIANSMVWEEYDLENGPLYRVFLIRLSATEYILGVALHHAIGDLLSIGIMFQELLSIYGSVALCAPLRLSPVRLRYMDYLSSMESWSSGTACGEYLRYWKDKLRSSPVTGLPSDGKRPLYYAGQESTGESKFLLDAEASSDLKKIAVRLKTTLFTVLLAIYKIALWRMTGQEEPVVVTLYAGRLNAGFQNAIGNFALEAAYKTCLSGNPDFMELAGRVTRAMNEAHLRQPVPLDWARRALAEEGVHFCAPGINFISAGDGRARNHLESRQLKFTPPGARHGCHGFPAACAIEFRDGDGVIEGSMVYRNDLYEESTIRAFINCFIQTAYGAIRFPEKGLVSAG
ncbi:MAG: condensation domain-containing protein [Acidobacteriota bacterium]|jgi:hypothetical protein|nr:condensation domain-containing protein [Acidobacteriota bacterium]